jgi:hypothetical protein
VGEGLLPTAVIVTSSVKEMKIPHRISRPWKYVAHTSSRYWWIRIQAIILECSEKRGVGGSINLLMYCKSTRINPYEFGVHQLVDAKTAEGFCEFT